MNFYYFDDNNKNNIVQNIVSSRIVAALRLHPYWKLTTAQRQTEQPNQQMFALNNLPGIPKEHQLSNDTPANAFDILHEEPNRSSGKFSSKERSDWKIFAVIMDRIFLAIHLIVICTVSVYYYFQIML